MKLAIIVLLTLITTAASAQVFLKTALGGSNTEPVGILTEVDAGYVRGKDQLSIGWQFNPQFQKAFYSLKYGYHYQDFIFYGGIGLVNQFINRERDYYVDAYGAPVLGVEYSFTKINENATLIFGAEVVDKTFNIKAGIRISYSQFSVF